MVEKFSVQKASRAPASSEMVTLLNAYESQTPKEKKDMLKFPHREAVGVLMWMPTMTRPNIVSAVRAVASFCEYPGLAHKKAALKVTQYLLHTKE